MNIIQIVHLLFFFACNEKKRNRAEEEEERENGKYTESQRCQCDGMEKISICKYTIYLPSHYSHTRYDRTQFVNDDGGDGGDDGSITRMHNSARDTRTLIMKTRILRLVKSR